MDKIAQLEAEANPWAEAKGWISSWQGQGDYPVVVSYVRHLEAELESAKNCEIDENGHFVREIVEAEPCADENGHIVFPTESDKEPDLFAGTKATVSEWYDLPHPCVEWCVAFYVRHLEADNTRLKSEIDALKAEPHADENGHIVFPDEKAEADPWREAKDWVLAEFVHLGGPAPVALYVRRLEAENSAKAARIAELESRPVPPLDPKRVIATACKVIAKTEPYYAGIIMQMCQAGDAGIYPLAGDEPT
jgi:hypothetical protein